MISANMQLLKKLRSCVVLDGEKVERLTLWRLDKDLVGIVKRLSRKWEKRWVAFSSSTLENMRRVDDIERVSLFLCLPFVFSIQIQ
jgi:hypothetical protein